MLSTYPEKLFTKWFSLNSVTNQWQKDLNHLYGKPTSYHWTIQSKVTDRIFELASVIYQIRWIEGNSLYLIRNFISIKEKLYCKL